jgi:hypothetical protein
MLMNDILSELLKAVLTVVIPILAGYLVTLIQGKSKSIMAGANSTIAKDLVTGAEKIIVDAVQATNQTFVDELKKAGKFDAAAAEEAFKRTKDAVLKILPQSTKDALSVLYGDVDAWLSAQIESTVKAVKTAVPAAADKAVEATEK